MPRKGADLKAAVPARTLNVPGGSLAYDLAGQGTPILFLHAAIADRRMWEREFQANAAEHQVVRVDLRGLGASPAARAPYSDVEDVRAVLDQVGSRAATLVGCSNGGRLAIDVAVSYPQRVRALLLVAPGLSGFDGSTDPEGQADYDRDGSRLKPVFDAWKAGRKEEALEGLQSYWCSQQHGENLDLVRTMMRENAEEIFTDASASHAQGIDPPAIQRLRSVRAPTIVLSGDHDEPTCGWIARRVAKDIPGARFVPVRGADHLVNLSQPAAFDAALRQLTG